VKFVPARHRARLSAVTAVVLTMAIVAAACSNSSPSAAPDTTLAPIQGFISDVTIANGDSCEFFVPANCLLPFPSNHFTKVDTSTGTGLRVNFTRAAMPANVDGVHIDPTEWNRNDGFSPGGPIITQIPGVDLAASQAPPITDIARSLDPNSPIVLLDADTGERRAFFAELDSHVPAGDPKQALTIHPAANLTDGHRYVVALRDLKRADGAAIDAQPAFVAYRDRLQTDVPAIEARREAMESIFATLAAAGVGRDNLDQAWDFTVASTTNLTDRVLAMRDDAFASLAGKAPTFTVTSTQENTDGAATGWLRIVKGTLDVPSYLTGAGDAGTVLNNGTDPTGIPTRNGTIAVPFTCVIPRSATAQAAPTLLYGHGLLGSQEEGEGVGKGVGDELKANVCAVDWIGMASGDLGAIVIMLKDLSGFRMIPDRLQQSFVNFLFLGRAAKATDGFATNLAFQTSNGTTPPTPAMNGEVAFVGNSQGGIFGGSLSAVAQDWTRAFLGVPGMSYATLLNRSVDFDKFDPLFTDPYPDRLVNQLNLGLMQMLWDRGENDGCATHLTSDPLPSTPAKQVLLFAAFGDHQVANVTTDVLARTIGAKIRQPALADGRSTDVTPFWGIEAADSLPYNGSAYVMWDFGTPAPPLGNTPNRAGKDPHGMGRDDPNVLRMVDTFLREGQLIDVCAGAPCAS